MAVSITNIKSTTKNIIVAPAVAAALVAVADLTMKKRGGKKNKKDKRSL
jgi:hypothetical protein